MNKTQIQANIIFSSAQVAHLKKYPFNVARRAMDFAIFLIWLQDSIQKKILKNFFKYDCICHILCCIITKKGEKMVKIVNANIVDDEIISNVDAIINPTNPYMIFGSGVCGAIFKKAGIQELEEYCKNMFSNTMKTCEIRITPGFNLHCDIVFAQGPRVIDYKKYEDAEFDLLLTYKNVLKECIRRGYKSIAIPSLGTGIYGFKNEIVARKVLEILNCEEKMQILFVHISKEVCELYNKIEKEIK